MSNPLVSIGLPVVKANYLKDSIESCLIQTHENIEVIIQNNAKHPNIKTEIRDLVSQYSDPRIKYFETEEQLPMVQNWNSTLEKAKGEYFSILCDDDFWEPTFLEEMMKLSFEFTNSNLFHSRIAIVNEKEKIIKLSSTCPSYEDGIDFIFHRVDGSRITYLSDFVTKTKALKELGGFVDFPDGWGSDTFTWFKIALNGGVAYTSKILFNYRISEINVTNSKRLKFKYLALDLHYRMLNQIITNISFGTDRYSTACKEGLIEKISNYIPENRKIIFFNLLIKKYKLPIFITHFFYLIFRISIELKNMVLFSTISNLHFKTKNIKKP